MAQQSTTMGTQHRDLLRSDVMMNAEDNNLVSSIEARSCRAADASNLLLQRRLAHNFLWVLQTTQLWKIVEGRCPSQWDISCHGLAMAWRHSHAPEGVPGSWHLWLRQNANYATFSSSDRLVSALNLYGKRTGDNFTRSRSKTQTCQTWRKNRNSRPR